MSLSRLSPQETERPSRPVMLARTVAVNDVARSDVAVPDIAWVTNPFGTITAALQNPV